MARTLASIQKIVALDSIPGADKILHAQVLGWKCITSIDNGFKAGDLCIYIEIDSRVPAIPQFAFLEKRHYKVKTIKMRGVFSQGLICPLKDFPTLIGYEEGKDVTDILGITQINTYEPGECSFGNKKQHPLDRFLCRFKLYRKVRPFFINKNKGWPTEIPHTDETRIQSIICWNMKEAFEKKTWYITTKIDGQSATYYYKRGIFHDFFGLYSRELRKKEGDNSNWAQMAQKYNIKAALKKFKTTVWIQGEIAGPSIQGNKNRFTEKRFFVFNVYIPNLKRYLNLEEMEDFCIRTKLEMVPIVLRDITLENTTIDELVKMSNGPSEWSKDDLREGIVVRERNNHDLSRISFKVISPEFQLKYNV